MTWVGPRIAVSQELFSDMGYDIGKSLLEMSRDAADRMLHPRFGPQQPYPVGPPEPSFDHCYECGHEEWTPGFRSRPVIGPNT